ncbi:MAG: dTMP kinase [Chloroflexota bacterium]|nr:dTMP kinase [Chloroflexota bacterium]
MFISFEGPEGSGKTTQIAFLASWLQSNGLKAFTTREPGGSAIGDRVREILLDPVATEMQPEAEVLLFSAARAQIVGQIIRPRLDLGDIVICDRYADSTMAYQGYGHQMDLEQLAAITTFATGGLVPALTVYLDIDVEAGLMRKQQDAYVDSSQWNRMERKDVAFHRRVRAGYLEMAADEPARWLVVDANQPAPVVQAVIRDRVAQALTLEAGA